MGHPGTIFLLEDNPQRLDKMLEVIGALLPDREIHVEDDCAIAVAWLRVNQSKIDLVSLDHDLDSVPRNENPKIDHGCGRPVADYLATQHPTCPVIIHTSNATAGDGMYHELRRAGWPVFRVYPYNHHEWVAIDWAKMIRELQSKGWLNTDNPSSPDSGLTLEQVKKRVRRSGFGALRGKIRILADANDESHLEDFKECM